jgi:hypothetical protein
MKQLVLVVFLFFKFIAAGAQDTLTLKSGSKVGGKIIKMEDGIIQIKQGKEIVTYTVDEVGGISFCSTVKGKGPSYSKGNSGFSKSNSSEGGKNFNEVEDNNNKGTVIFECIVCGTEGSLKIYGTKENSKSTSQVKFSSDETNFRFGHKELLLPGEYNWEYKDNKNKPTGGKLLVKAGEISRIQLFENK